MTRSPLTLALIAVLLAPISVSAWNKKTHMAIAYIAYRKLNRNARSRVDEILVLHPMYGRWTQGVKIGQKGLIAFMEAASWPDCIQDASACPGYEADGADNGMQAPNSQQSWQNIGFSDKLMHKYWHFIDQPYASGDLQTENAQQPNLQTQAMILTQAIASNVDDSLKSYDLAWLEDLVADIHEPTNCINRFTGDHPHGDHGGRKIGVCSPPCQNNLHEYWSDIFGNETDLDSALELGKLYATVPNPGGFESTDIPKWINQSFEVAKVAVYARPFDGSDSTTTAVETPDPMYHKQAYDAAVRQLVLAGNRLAILLNQNLK